ncbi:tetratricopeptide repeat protein [Thetidibacter halocola]|uniref:Winged helix-turn-helix domain-containing protein n=1 Tax=Thetidibacter halocola TaxID=2827239 RepID=A0A8J7WEU7_9RHOB|nr:tetratricopeptide repeat protein [Thetidibacter halocola]MBS0126337.1 winged helix-turn-helix domain-containing protein [Thetidibacter halocola]
MTGLEILPAQRLARLDGQDLSLGARAFDVLVVLHDNAERVVSKTELLDTVWSDRMVEESNLTVQIATLRKALGAKAIGTVPGVGYKLTLGGAATDGPSRAAPPLPDKPSLAVLPFANLTGDPGRDYLVDGIVNELASALSVVSSFFVVSTTSSFSYKGKVVDLATVGEELGVRYVLEGGIQQAGPTLRISTQLVECETGHTLWRGKFDGASDDLFALQDQVAESVAAALEPKLIWAEAARTRRKPTESLDAYDLCLRAAPMVYVQNTLDNLEEGLALLHRAVALDPDYAQARALICYAHTGAFATRWWSHEKASAAIPLARALLDSNTDDPLVLAYAGHYIAYLGGEPGRGLTALQRAAALNPNSGTVSMLLGWVYNYLDRPDEAIEQLQRARRISPLHPQIGIITSGIGQAQIIAGNYETAVRHLEQALTEFPEFATIQLSLMGCYWALGRRDDAERMADWFRAKVPDMSVSLHNRTRPFISERLRAIMVEALEGLGFPP